MEGLQNRARACELDRIEALFTLLLCHLLEMVTVRVSHVYTARSVSYSTVFLTLV
jgi:hypothetical protein